MRVNFDVVIILIVSYQELCQSFYRGSDVVEKKFFLNSFYGFVRNFFL